MSLATDPQIRPDPGAVLTKALIRTLDLWGVSGREAAPVLGISEATLSRLRRAGQGLEPGTKPFELAALTVRAWRALDAITGGDPATAKAWLRSENAALGGIPLERMRSVQGLVDVATYLDARRAPL